ncbi:MAG: AraC family transcriptional regulator [Bacteroidetes bacterium]|uniref:AraC family transcriptional regulator n=1 Tax=Candidatus Cryptobacteroides faecavium TaxID=2840762 RepID=A0A9D9IG46_9BACT|nr:AraC family transcriptional regulator [Candidatus Cryptobacteroides faecavium]
MCISPRYLNKITVRHVDGLSPKNIIDDQLLAEIKVRLVNSSLSITQIAGELNFSDQTYMSSFFRRLTGRSPADYRKSAAR